MREGRTILTSNVVIVLNTIIVIVIIVIIVIVITVIITIVILIIILIFTCTPLQSWWDRYRKRDPQQTRSQCLKHSL